MSSRESTVYKRCLPPLRNVRSDIQNPSCIPTLSWPQEFRRPPILSLDTSLFLSILLANFFIMLLAHHMSIALAIEAIGATAITAPLVAINGFHFRSPSQVLQGDAALEERQNNGPAQVVLIGCPEMFKEPAGSCSACGGEDPSHAGKCKNPNESNWYCACKS